MKKGIKIYGICWFILVAIFNVIVFITPNEAAEMSKFGGAFWSGYIFIMLAFIGQLICSVVAFKEENKTRFFYKLPLITVSYSALIASIVVGILCMAIPDLPNWVGIIVCVLILGIYATALLKASAAADIVSDIDEKIATKTSFIKSITVDAQNLMNHANDDTTVKYCKKIYEALQYSDPMSDDALADIEIHIKEEFNAFTDAVLSKNATNVELSAEELLALISGRNNKCKLLK